MVQDILSGGGSLAASLMIFVIAAAVVWRAGARLAGYADRFANAMGMSGALVGLLLLGGVTSLPEIATSATAALGGAASLASNNLIGGVALQILALAIVDALVGRKALTAIVPRPDVLAYAAMNIAMLVLVAGLIAWGDREAFGSGVGWGTVLVAVAYGLCLASARAIDRSPTWRPVRTGGAEPRSEDSSPGERPKDPAMKLVLLIGLSGAVILVGGFLLARSGEALAQRTGLGESFFGAVFLAGATSLPELSSAIAAVRLKRPQMAIGDILGGNLFNLSLLALVDGLYREAPVLGELGEFSILAACVGAFMCAALIIGLVERRDRTVLRIGYDSAAIVVIYLGSLVLLYTLSD